MENNKEATMEPLLMVLIPSLFGGLVLAWLIARNRSTTPPTFVPRRLEAPSPSLINMSSIKVEGLGGLGMVAAVIAVAIADSRIRLAMIIALILGGGLALALIAMRGRTKGSGSTDGPDDRSMLHLEGERAEIAEATECTTKERRQRRQTKEMLRVVQSSRVLRLDGPEHLLRSSSLASFLRCELRSLRGLRYLLHHTNLKILAVERAGSGYRGSSAL
jgi:hypothetical protein